MSVLAGAGQRDKAIADLRKSTEVRPGDQGGANDHKRLGVTLLGRLAMTAIDAVESSQHWHSSAKLRLLFRHRECPVMAQTRR